MKRITLLCTALFMSALAFSQTCTDSIVRVDRNNGSSGCQTGFGGARVYITFLFLGTDCAIIPTPPPITIFDGLTELTTAQVSAGVFIACTVSGDSRRVTYRYCTSVNLGPAGSLCAAITGCTGTRICEEAGGPLPVTLSSFLAARSGNNVNMKWSTSTEINSKEFVIQKKVGVNWVDFAVVPSQNRANGATYSYTDVNTAKGITEYRLKMVDFGGASKLSEIRPIKGLSGASDFTIYPNPSNGTAYVALSESFEKSTVQLMDNAGRVLKTETLQANGSTSFKNLTPGYYLIRVKNNVSGEVVTQKLSVIK